MAIYCIWSGGDGTQTNTTQTAGTLDWSKADASVADLIAYDAAAFTTSSNTIYFADDHNDPNKAAHWTLTGPTSGLPVILISADRTLSTPTVKTGTGNQLSSLGGAYDLTLDGGLALYSMRVAAGNDVWADSDGNELFIACNCTVAVTRVFWPQKSGTGRQRWYNTIVDGLSASSASYLINTYSGAAVEMVGVSFVGCENRTGAVFYSSPVGLLSVSSVDFTGITNASCELARGSPGSLIVSGCKTGATYTPIELAPTAASGTIDMINTGPADAPASLRSYSYVGALLSSTDIYRTGGATVEGVACSWLITTTAYCSEHTPFYTPWRYGTLSSTGSKTFSVYITNDTADLNDNEIWLEVEYKSEATEAIWALATDQRATITTTAAAQTDDTASTWNGSGPSYTYKQKLSVTTTVNQVGQYRVRVAIGKTSVAGSAYLYIDPAVAVS